MLNWTQLTAQGRAKDIGIAWTEEEQEALTLLSAHTGLERAEVARYVRKGILTVADFEKSEKPDSRADLEAKAKEVGVAFDATAASDTVLEKAIASAKPKKK